MNIDRGKRPGLNTCPETDRHATSRTPPVTHACSQTVFYQETSDATHLGPKHWARISKSGFQLQARRQTRQMALLTPGGCTGACPSEENGLRKFTIFQWLSAWQRAHNTINKATMKDSILLSSYHFLGSRIIHFYNLLLKNTGKYNPNIPQHEDLKNLWQ